MEFDELMLERRGKTGARARRTVSCAWRWRDEVDGTPQYCRAYLPAGYDRRRSGRTVLQLHGYNPANPVYWDWWSADNRGIRSDTEFAGHQRRHLHRAAWPRQHAVHRASATPTCCAASPRRSGCSRSTKTACISPAIPWAAGARGTSRRAIPICSPPSRRCSAAWTITRQMTEEQLAALDAGGAILQEKRSSWSMADSLINMPVYVHHGDRTRR